LPRQSHCGMHVLLRNERLHAARAPNFLLLDLNNDWEFFVAVWRGFGPQSPLTTALARRCPFNMACSLHSEKFWPHLISGYLKRPETSNFWQWRSQQRLGLFWCRLVDLRGSTTLHCCILADGSTDLGQSPRSVKVPPDLTFRSKKWWVSTQNCSELFDAVLRGHWPFAPAQNCNTQNLRFRLSPATLWLHCSTLQQLQSDIANFKGTY